MPDPKECIIRHAFYCTGCRAGTDLSYSCLYMQQVHSNTSLMWDTSALDPRLFSQTSELAGALTLSPLIPRSQLRHDQLALAEGRQALPKSPRQSTSSASRLSDPPPPTQGPEIHPVLAEVLKTIPNIDAPPRFTSGPTVSVTASPEGPLPPRFCSIKGCKTLIPGNSFFKMCEPCRDRYRNYGTKKRAKWKHEKQVAVAELNKMRAEEDARRAAQGLPPLPRDDERWRELEPPDEDADGNGNGGGASAPLPRAPRMCTVSHCREILPAGYQFLRCERHRIQNRHHSKLKRVRDKDAKAQAHDDWVAAIGGAREASMASGGGDDADGGEAEMQDAHADDADSAEEDGGETADAPNVGSDVLITAEDIARALGAIATGTPTDPLGTQYPSTVPALAEDTPDFDVDGRGDEDEDDEDEDDEEPFTEDTPLGEPRHGLPPAARGMRRTNHVCSIRACANLLSPNNPWKMCDLCRSRDRAGRRLKALRDSGLISGAVAADRIWAIRSEVEGRERERVRPRRREKVEKLTLAVEEREKAKAKDGVDARKGKGRKGKKAAQKDADAQSGDDALGDAGSPSGGATAQREEDASSSALVVVFTEPILGPSTDQQPQRLTEVCRALLFAYTTLTFETCSRKALRPSTRTTRTPESGSHRQQKPLLRPSRRLLSRRSGAEPRVRRRRRRNLQPPRTPTSCNSPLRTRQHRNLAILLLRLPSLRLNQLLPEILRRPCPPIITQLMASLPTPTICSHTCRHIACHPDTLIATRRPKGPMPHRLRTNLRTVLIHTHIPIQVNLIPTRGSNMHLRRYHHTHLRLPSHIPLKSSHRPRLQQKFMLLLYNNHHRYRHSRPTPPQYSLNQKHNSSMRLRCNILRNQNTNRIPLPWSSLRLQHSRIPLPHDLRRRGRIHMRPHTCPQVPNRQSVSRCSTTRSLTRPRNCNNPAASPNRALPRRTATRVRVQTHLLKRRTRSLCARARRTGRVCRARVTAFASNLRSPSSASLPGTTCPANVGSRAHTLACLS